MEILNYIQKSIGFYFGDEESYNYIDKKVTWQNALFASIGFSFFISLISIFIEYTYTNNPNFLVENLITIVLLSAILLPIVIFILSGLIYLCFKFFNGKGDFFSTLKFWVSISIFSTLLLALIEIIPSRFFSESTNKIFDIVYAIYILALIIWGFVVSLRVFSRLNDLPVWKTAIALLIPVLIMIVIAVIIFLIIYLFFGGTF